jgi:hypothetical protein
MLALVLIECILFGAVMKPSRSRWAWIYFLKEKRNFLVTTSRLDQASTSLKNGHTHISQEHEVDDA